MADIEFVPTVTVWLLSFDLAPAYLRPVARFRADEEWEQIDDGDEVAAIEELAAYLGRTNAVPGAYRIRIEDAHGEMVTVDLIHRADYMPPSVEVPPECTCPELRGDVCNGVVGEDDPDSDISCKHCLAGGHCQNEEP